MAEATVIGMIQDLEILHRTGSNDRAFIGIKIKELNEMLDFLREFSMEERSRLKYLTADLVELAQDVMDEKFRVMTREALIKYSFSFNPHPKLKRLHDEIKVIRMRMINFGVDEKNIGDEEGEEEEVAVGLEKDVKKLLDKAIFRKSNRLRSFCIKGMIGIGKTTLARQVYKAGASQFQRHAWVSISRGTSRKEILMKLIQQMVVGYERGPSLDEMDNRSLQQMLHLQGLSFFIVLDNIQEVTDFNYFFKFLRFKGLTGRLLITSRCELMANDIDYTHEMSALDSDKSWQLFLKTINKYTRDENKFTKDLERKGKEMLKKCWGLPMAIVNVARQKANQRRSGIEWEELFDSIDLSESLKLLEPMYHELEESVKPQFLHFSLFKENAKMRQEKLEHIWAATGLHFGGVARGFACRSILEVVKLHFEKRKYRLHPLLHMISIQKAEEEMGLEILRSNENNRPSQDSHHRVIHCGRDKFNHLMNEDNKYLISLIFHGGGGYLDDTSSSYWESFESLKIIDMEDFGVKTLSEAMGALTELLYLGLRNNYIQEIPHSLMGLEKLKVLDITLNFIAEVPNTIEQMGNLRDLHMSNVIFRKPLKVDALRKLMNLTYISIYDWTYEDPSFKSMYDLKTLGVEEVDENSDVGTLFATLAKLLSFERLFIRGFRYRNMPCLDEIGVIKRLKVLKLHGRIGRLPSADNLPKEIRYIALINTCLDEDPMPILEKLSSLSKLKLRNAYTGREMVIEEGGFRRLDALCINELWNLRMIQVDEDAMCNLTKLEINNCPHLETLPERIRSMPGLRKFKMVTTKHIAKKIRHSGLTSKVLEEEIIP
ncbi:probable disease resistance protein At1g58602 [Salvia hispanica]|uniref:probable disease resistance protein At1g58602 n=1 Tax=Salvia hispanica TaxID=49212 RepID=UPI002009013B|nr:probable disease resistance protein At1g58602 [Salvia hispanica]XP_047950486.1 probable disease resistance protein At1g58602 [Salvia hispanica]XP_047950487.1 probable disease resistance protein At1g58602 [Salvia hispanica]XP_047950488.1 probable disease resistance protein At1g58602 [Salvia hispanica]XP_047950489.1 probable disease resistance protein At1g58602 [Salvia hispanica]XP_047950490.1 probable disease resistance protein At1g58602 [Salvia hispanica]XP_047950491.1 probable disease res